MLRKIKWAMPIIPLLAFCVSICLARSQSGDSGSLNYRSFGRDQNAQHTPNENNVLRIWAVYVGQGDGILIQLPKKYNYGLDSDGNSDEDSERVDVMIDGGAHNKSDETKMLEFFQSLYPQSKKTIEHVIITHHDSDHITGLVRILMNPAIEVQNIYHNGLASYVKSRAISEDSNPYGSIKNKDCVMARLKEDKTYLIDDDLIDGMNKLKREYQKGNFNSYYRDLAKAVIEKSEPASINRFSRVHVGTDFIKEVESSQKRELPELEFNLLWPLKNLKHYKDWGYTINGNSLTFLLRYGDFEMLFTGDQNDLSEQDLLDYLKRENIEEMLYCDVLKVPHHGSSYNLKDFVAPKKQPVLSVASMGARGFSSDWQHPSNEVISWAGGAHRFYSTYIHERRFDWEAMEDKDGMIEKKHILIETDGNWFRIVEIDLSWSDLDTPPAVRETRRGNGTLWIKAK